VTNGFTRRAWLASLPALAAAQRAHQTAKLARAPGEFLAFADPTTEARVVRLTNPANTSVLPAAANRLVSIRNRFLICTSDRAGPMAPFRLDLRLGLAHQLAEPTALVPESLSLDDKERSLYLLDGDTLGEIGMQSRKARTVAEDVSAFALGPGGRLFVVRSGKLQMLDVGGTIAEDVAPFCLPRPDGGGCVFLRRPSPGEVELWYAPLPVASGKPVRLAQGAVSNPFWSPQGRSVLFLREFDGPAGKVSEIHEARIDGTSEQCVAPTSNFAAFAPNGDASVFVGASRSRAQPTVVLLLRSTRREFTLCEHRSSDAGRVSPVFSPDSRRVYFQSDHEGKRALYSVNVELLVEPTPAA
jgi:oligogalacturonide lyase